MNENVEFSVFLSGPDEAVSTLLDTLAEQPWPKDALPPHLRLLTEQIHAKYDLPAEFAGCLLLSMIGAHLGSSIRMGEDGEFGLPLNFKFAFVPPGSRRLPELFRTLGSSLFEAEESSIRWSNRRRGKRATVAEEETAEYNASQLLGKKDKKIEEMDECYEELAKLQRLERPHLIFDEGAPSFLSEMLEYSSDDGLFALSDSGGPVPRYLREWNARDRSAFVELFRKASDMIPDKRPSSSKGHWGFAGKPLLNVFWAIRHPHLVAALQDATMANSGFWDDFVLADFSEGSEIECVRIGRRMTMLAEWQNEAKRLFLMRKLNRGRLISSSEESDALFSEFSRELTDLLSALPVGLRNPVRKWVTLSQKLSAALQLVVDPSGMKILPEQARSGIALTRWLGAQTLRLQHRAVVSATTSDDEAAERAMLDKIEAKGPVSFRSLLRSYRKQSKSLHEPTLESLRRKGVVTLGSDELIRLAA